MYNMVMMEFFTTSILSVHNGKLATLLFLFLFGAALSSGALSNTINFIIADFFKRGRCFELLVNCKDRQCLKDNGITGT